MSSIARNTDRIRSGIAEACGSCSRDPRDIILMAVTKTRSIDEVLEVISCGISHVGENRVQELQKKSPLVTQAQVHMIGPLQSNKVRTAVQYSSCIQTVEREKILKKIASCSADLGKTMDVMVEVNTSGEESKHGAATEDEVYHLLELSLSMDHLRPVGLMTMGPLGASEQEIRRCFSSLYSLRERVYVRYPELKGTLLLSMGMSGDYHHAVREGSDLLRIGSAFFS